MAAVVTIMILYLLHLAHITVCFELLLRLGLQFQHAYALVAVEEVIPARRSRQQIRRRELPAPAIRAAKVEKEACGTDRHDCSDERDKGNDEASASQGQTRVNDEICHGTS